MKLDHMTLHRGMRTQPATKAFANGPAAIVRVETVTRSDEPMKQLVAGTTKDAAWTLQAVSEPLRELTDSKDAHAVSGAPFSALEERTGTRVGVVPGYELQVRAPAMLTVTLKQGGVEKARVIAKAQPGAQRV